MCKNRVSFLRESPLSTTFSYASHSTNKTQTRFQQLSVHRYMKTEVSLPLPIYLNSSKQPSSMFKVLSNESPSM